MKRISSLAIILIMSLSFITCGPDDPQGGVIICDSETCDNHGEVEYLASIHGAVKDAQCVYTKPKELDNICVDPLNAETQKTDAEGKVKVNILCDAGNFIIECNNGEYQEVGGAKILNQDASIYTVKKIEAGKNSKAHISFFTTIGYKVAEAKAISNETKLLEELDKANQIISGLHGIENIADVNPLNLTNENSASVDISDKAKKAGFWTACYSQLACDLSIKSGMSCDTGLSTAVLMNHIASDLKDYLLDGKDENGEDIVVLNNMKLNSDTYRYDLVKACRKVIDDPVNKSGLTIDHVKPLIDEYINSGYLGEPTGTVVEDTTPPVITCDIQEGAHVNGDYTINCEAKDDESKIKSFKIISPFESEDAVISDAANSPVKLSHTIDTTKYVDGNFEIIIAAKNDSILQSKEVYNLLLDNTGPQVEFKLPGHDETISGEFEIRVEANNDLSDIAYIKVSANSDEIDNQHDKPEETNIFYAKVSANDFEDGALTLTAIAEDVLGNMSEEAELELTINKNAPDITINSPASGTTVSGDVPINLTCSDNQGIESISVVACGTAIGDLETDHEIFEGVWVSTECPDGETEIKVTATDSNGINGSKTIIVNVDNVPPGMISGTVSVGSVVKEADVTLYDFTGGEKGNEPISETVTDSEGNFSLSVDHDNFEGPLLIVVSGTDANFIDQTANTQVNFYSEFNLRTIIENYKSGETLEDVYVTGWTTIASIHAVCKINKAESSDDGVELSVDGAKELSYNLIAEHFRRYAEPWGFSLGNVKPYDFTSGPAPGLNDAVLSGFAETMLSQLAYQLSEAEGLTPATDLTLMQIIDLLSKDIRKDCIFNGSDNGMNIRASTGHLFNANTTRNYLANAGHDLIVSERNLSGLTKGDTEKIFQDMSTDTSELYPPIEDAPTIDFDKTAPVFDSIVPTSGTFSDKIDFDIISSDNSGIAPIITIKNPTDNITYTLQEPGHITGSIDVLEYDDEELKIIIESMDLQENFLTEIITVQINHAGPVITVSQPSALGWFSTNQGIDFNISAQDDQGVLDLSCDVGENKTLSSSELGELLIIDESISDTSQFTDGKLDIVCIAHDDLGNPSTAEFSIYIDNTPPNLVIDPVDNWCVGSHGRVNFTGNASDTGSDIVSLEVHVNGNLFETVTASPYLEYQVTLEENGQHQVQFVLIDKVGHRKESSAIMVQKDVFDPEITLLSLSGDSNIENTVEYFNGNVAMTATSIDDNDGCGLKTFYVIIRNISGNICCINSPVLIYDNDENDNDNTLGSISFNHNTVLQNQHEYILKFSAVSIDTAGNIQERDESYHIRNTVQANGTASKGIVKNSKITFYGYDESGNRIVLSESGQTKSNGEFIVDDIKPYEGDILVEVTRKNEASKYDDEVCGTDVQLSDTNKLQTIIENVKYGDTLKEVQVTPLTTMAVSCKIAGREFTDCVDQIQDHFDIDNILNTRPNRYIGNWKTLDTYTKYALINAAFAQLPKEMSTNDVDCSCGIVNGMKMTEYLAADMQDGKMDGSWTDNSLSWPCEKTITENIFNLQISKAIYNFVDEKQYSFDGVTTNDLINSGWLNSISINVTDSLGEQISFLKQDAGSPFDVEGPRIDIISIPEGWQKDSYDITVSVNDTMSDVLKCEANTKEGFAIENPESNFTIPIVPSEYDEVEKILTITCADQYQNKTVINDISLKFDTNEPEINLERPLNNSYINTQSKSFIISAVDQLSGIDVIKIKHQTPYIINIPDPGTYEVVNECMRDSNGYYVCSTAKNMPTGANKITIESTDKIGNKATKEYNINVDVESPVAEVEFNRDDRTFYNLVGGSVRATATITDYFSKITECELVGKPSGVSDITINKSDHVCIMEFNWNTTAVSGEIAGFTFKSTDQAGNELKNGVVSVKVDNEPPEISSNVPSLPEWTNKLDLIVKDISVSEDTYPEHPVTVTLNRRDIVEFQAQYIPTQINVQLPYESYHEFTLTVEDFVGNKASETRTVKLDMMKPSFMKNPNAEIIPENTLIGPYFTLEYHYNENWNAQETATFEMAMFYPNQGVTCEEVEIKDFYYHHQKCNINTVEAFGEVDKQEVMFGFYAIDLAGNESFDSLKYVLDNKAPKIYTRISGENQYRRMESVGEYETTVTYFPDGAEPRIDITIEDQSGIKYVNVTGNNLDINTDLDQHPTEYQQGYNIYPSDEELTSYIIETEDTTGNGTHRKLYFRKDTEPPYIEDISVYEGRGCSLFFPNENKHVIYMLAENENASIEVKFKDKGFSGVRRINYKETVELCSRQGDFTVEEVFNETDNINGTIRFKAYLDGPFPDPKKFKMYFETYDNVGNYSVIPDTEILVMIMKEEQIYNVPFDENFCESYFENYDID